MSVVMLNYPSRLFALPWHWPWGTGPRLDHVCLRYPYVPPRGASSGLSELRAWDYVQRRVIKYGARCFTLSGGVRINLTKFVRRAVNVPTHHGTERISMVTRLSTPTLHGHQQQWFTLGHSTSTSLVVIYIEPTIHQYQQDKEVWEIATKPCECCYTPGRRGIPRGLVDGCVYFCVICDHSSCCQKLKQMCLE